MARGPKYIAIDMDGPIAEYDKFRKPNEFGALVDGVREAISFLRQNGWKVIIFSSRGGNDLVKYLRDNDIEYDYINCNPEVVVQNCGKPYFDVLVDDKCLRFEGDWESTLQDVFELPIAGDGYYKEVVEYKEVGDGRHGWEPKEETEEPGPEQEPEQPDPEEQEQGVDPSLEASPDLEKEKEEEEDRSDNL